MTSEFFQVCAAGQVKVKRLQGMQGCACNFMLNFKCRTLLTAPPPLHMLNQPLRGPVGGIADLTANPLQACIALTFAQARRWWRRLRHYYVNVHTDQFPGGAIRSQLSGTAQPPPPAQEFSRKIWPDWGAVIRRSGHRQFAIAGRTLCFTMKTNLQGIVAEHIHEGAAGVDGDVYVDLFGGIADLTANPLQACITLTHAQAKALVKTPTDYYVNVHT
ncbi:hypothetical protein JKP88DRAFT_256272, partial [Tribonema minus]